MSEKHADDPSAAKPDQRFKGKGAMNASEASAVCLVCHEGQNNKKLLLWAGSTHPQADVGCTSCHTIHVNKDPVFNKAAQSDVCFACHKDTRVAMNKPWRHPVQEGKMSCSDCHSPHGSAGPKLAKRDTINATCYQCHAEKRGPYVHNHQPVQDNCASCHNPHGSNVAAMLTARDPILCNQCHVPHAVGGIGAVRGQPGVLPPAVPPQTRSAVTPLSGGINTVNVWQGRSCLNCHTQVHGSNNPSPRSPAPSNLFR
jgi:DmsE family decaheme c-type cytochrome